MDAPPPRGLLPLGAAAFALSAALFAVIQFAGPNIVGVDSYYHIKMAELIREQGLFVDFPWLKFTILDRAGYTDHHLLLHVLEIPFTWLGDLELAAKLAPIAFAAAAFTAIVVVLARHGVPRPLLWLLPLFAASGPFLFRMSMVRGQSLSLALQVLAFHAILRRRPLALGAVAAVFVWAYNGFPLLAPLVAFGLLVHYAAERKVEYRLALGAAAGIAVGLVVNPYFPRNVLFLWDHIVPKLFAVRYATAVGSEWYPYSSWGLLTLSPLAVLAYLASLALLDPRSWGRDKPRLFWLLTATMYFFLLLKSRRFVEYFPPAAVICLAFSLRERLQAASLADLTRTAARAAGTVAASVALAAALALSLGKARQLVAGQRPTGAWRGGAEWLARNTPAGSAVFHTDWDDFPMLFFHNTHNVYLVGLDPDFMRLKHPLRFQRWERIAAGRVPRPEKEILDEFGCRYVIADRGHRRFIEVADGRPRMRRVYEDATAVVYRILDPQEIEAPRGEPAPPAAAPGA